MGPSWGGSSNKKNEHTLKTGKSAKGSFRWEAAVGNQRPLTLGLLVSDRKSGHKAQGQAMRKTITRVQNLQKPV